MHYDSIYHRTQASISNQTALVASQQIELLKSLTCFIKWIVMLLKELIIGSLAKSKRNSLSFLGEAVLRFHFSLSFHPTLQLWFAMEFCNTRLTLMQYDHASTCYQHAAASQHLWWHLPLSVTGTGSPLWWSTLPSRLYSGPVGAYLGPAAKSFNCCYSSVTCTFSASPPPTCSAISVGSLCPAKRSGGKMDWI